MAERRGVKRESIVIDPGIGFGKSQEQNLELIAKLDQLIAAFPDLPLLIGTSRKSFIGRILADESGTPAPPEDRLHGTMATITAAVLNGAHIVRVHDVKAAAETIRVTESIHVKIRRRDMRSNRHEKSRMTKLLRISLFILMLAFVSGFAECYKPVTKNQLPARIKTVAVPAFQMESQALRYKVESRFTDAVMRELVHRGRGLRVQGEREGADAVIEGVIKSFNFAGVLLDDKGRARIFEVTIAAAVTVRDQTENRVLYDNQNFVFRGEYEFASDPRSFFNEEDPAILRMSRSFAESIVSTLINAVEIGKK